MYLLEELQFGIATLFGADASAVRSRGERGIGVWASVRCQDLSTFYQLAVLKVDFPFRTIHRAPALLVSVSALCYREHSGFGTDCWLEGAL